MEIEEVFRLYDNNADAQSMEGLCESLLIALQTNIRLPMTQLVDDLFGICGAIEEAGPGQRDLKKILDHATVMASLMRFWAVYETLSWEKWQKLRNA